MDLDAFPAHFASSFPAALAGGALVAFSGGADSTALLHLLARSGLGLRLAAAYIHHRTREQEAAAEIASCRRHCESLGLPFVTRELAPLGLLPTSREARWRRQRYAALHELARDLRLATVATGHQRDDVAEGVLVQLLRGAGPRALAGIAADDGEGVIRPLLPWSRAEIEDWLRRHGLRWCEDSSNRTLDHLRNRVRHRLLPQLEADSPRLRQHLVHLAHTLAADEEHLAGELARAPWLDPWHPEGGAPLSELRALSPALRSRWLQAQARRLGLERASRRQTELFHALLDAGEPRAVSLDGRWSLRRAGASLWAEPPQGPGPYQLCLARGEALDLPLPGWRARCSGEATDPRPGAWSRSVPADGTLVVRSPLRGDRVRHGRSFRKLSSLLAQRLPRHLRSSWPVLLIDGTIEWIPGVWFPECHRGECTHRVEVFRQ